LGRDVASRRNKDFGGREEPEYDEEEKARAEEDEEEHSKPRNREKASGLQMCPPLLPPEIRREETESIFRLRMTCECMLERFGPRNRANPLQTHFMN
jgi:hypothetical protein